MRLRNCPAVQYLRVLGALVILFIAGCGGGKTGATDAPGGGIDAPGGGIDADLTKPTQINQTSGGGQAASANFRARIQVGAPQPMGKAESANYKARVGPTTE